MRIGVDARLLGAPHSSITKLLRNVLKCWSMNPKDDFVIYVSDLYNWQEEVHLDKFEVIQIKARTPLGFYWKLARRTTIDHLDVMLFTFDLAPFQAIPFTLLVHDLTFRKYEKSSLKNVVFSFLVKRSVKKAKAVVVPSNNTREDVVLQYHKEKDDVHTIYLDVDPAFTMLPHEVVQASLPSLIGDNKEGFALHVGRIHPTYKNITRLLEAFIKGKKDRRIREKLVIVSPDKPQRKDAKVIENNKRDIIILHKLTDQDLAVLYNACNYFVYPSLYEGFGMPVLEAMRCGAPVAVSRSSSIPEVAGNAGFYFNPYDANDIYRAMHELSRDENLRRELARKSLERSKFFSWEIFSEKVLEITKSVARR